CLQLRERFRKDLRVLRLHSDRGGEFSSDLLRDFCCVEGILQSFTLPESPQQNGIAERRIGLVMEVARTSIIHAAAPHFRWPFAVRTGKVGDASVFRVWGSRAFVRDSSADKLSAHAIPCVFLGFSPDTPGWQFYHATSRRIFPSHNVMFDESVPFYRLFLPPGPPPVLVEVLRLGVRSQGERCLGVRSLKVPSLGVLSLGVRSLGVLRTAGVVSGGAKPEGVEPRGVESWGAEPRSSTSSGGPAGASPRLSPRPEPLSLQQLRDWFTQRTHLPSGATGAGDSSTRATGAGGAGVTAGAGGTGGAAAAGPGGACTRGTGAAGTGSIWGIGAGDSTEPGAPGAGGTGAGGAGAFGSGARGPGAGGAGAGGAGAVDPEAGGAGAACAMPGGPGAGGTVRPRLYFVPLLQQVLGVPQPTPSPYTEQVGGLIERHVPASRPASPVCTGHRVPRPRPPPVPNTHAMALRPSSVPLRVPLPAPPESSLPAIPDLESDGALLPVPLSLVFLPLLSLTPRLSPLVCMP
ncbi:unnamed protein product, partial [Closterium sp. NIES-54]